MRDIISVVITCYNYGDYIADAIASVQRQTYSNWECIVVDDGSTDQTFDIVNAIITNDSRIKYFRQDNQGVAAARNFGIKLSSGKYILPLDADDYLSPEYLAEASTVFEKYPNVKLVYSDTMLFGAINGILRVSKYSFEQMLLENMIVCTAMFRRTDFDKTNGYDPKLKNLEDWDFWISFLDSDDVVFKINRPLFFYRKKKGSRNGEVDDTLHSVLRTDVVIKHARKYFKTFGDFIQLYKEYEVIRLSMEYRIGRIVMRPIRLIFPQNILSRIKKMFS
jgi:glycosyltransferase involved in cell wall biosynthesis